MARAHGLSRLRGLRGGRLGDDIDWGSIISSSITTAGQVAQVALKPPTYSAVQYPSGLISTQSYGAVPNTSSISGFLSPDVLLLGGLALVAVVLMKR
jgi:hypothetical protein